MLAVSHRVVAVDLRGFGDSGTAPGAALEAPGELARAILGFIDGIDAA